ncbi:MAG: hypothetical protein KDF56_05555 [Ottowia sp.]|nr:hypothetical protein [Ottowia sp.]
MQNLERRIEALEQRAELTDRIDVIFITWLTPGNMQPEIETARSEDGQCWHRKPGESSAVFRERVGNEARSPGRVVMVSTN